MYEQHNTKDNFLHGTFSLVCNKHFVAHLELFKKFLTSIFWTTKTA